MRENMKYKNMNLVKYDICDILSQLWDQCPACAHSHTLHCCGLFQKLGQKTQTKRLMMKMFLSRLSKNLRKKLKKLKQEYLL